MGTFQMKLWFPEFRQFRQFTWNLTTGCRELLPGLTKQLRSWPKTDWRFAWDLQVWVTVCFFFLIFLLFSKIKLKTHGLPVPLSDICKGDCILLSNHRAHCISPVLVCDWRSLCLFEQILPLLNNRKFRDWRWVSLGRNSILFIGWRIPLLSFFHGLTWSKLGREKRQV
jgi:hypothetical protein